MMKGEIILIFICLLGVFPSLKIEEICEMDLNNCETECIGDSTILSLEEWKSAPPHPRVSDLQIYGLNFRKGSLSLTDFKQIFPGLTSLDVRGSSFEDFSCGQSEGIPVLLDCSSSTDSRLKNAPGYPRSVCSCFGMEFRKSEQCSVRFYCCITPRI